MTPVGKQRLADIAFRLLLAALLLLWVVYPPQGAAFAPEPFAAEVGS